MRFAIMTIPEQIIPPSGVNYASDSETAVQAGGQARLASVRLTLCDFVVYFVRLCSALCDVVLKIVTTKPCMRILKVVKFSYQFFINVLDRYDLSPGAKDVPLSDKTNRGIVNSQIVLTQCFS